MSTSKGRVAVVDDNDSARLLYGDVLKGHGYEVATFADAEKLLGTPYDALDLIVSDLQLPGIHGIDMIRRATRQGVKCIAVSAGDWRLLGEAVSAGARLPLQKPFSNAVLVKAVELVLML